MLEQEFTAQLNQSSTPTADGNSKKRKAKTSTATAINAEEDEDDEYYGLGMKGKKPKAVGTGYAGNRQEDVSLTNYTRSNFSHIA